MQVVDKSCAMCGERVVAAAAGVGCPTCDLAYHVACLHQPGVCPECGGAIAPAARSGPPITQEQVERALEELRAQQNFGAGLVAGVIAALAGAGIWCAITVATGYQIGWMAVGIGFLVGFAVRGAGKGIDRKFGLAGALLSLLGCAAGNLLTGCYFLAQQAGVGLLDVLVRLNGEAVAQILKLTFSPMDVLFYGIAVYEGFKLSLRRVTAEELRAIVEETRGV